MADLEEAQDDVAATGATPAMEEESKDISIPKPTPTKTTDFLARWFKGPRWRRQKIP